MSLSPFRQILVIGDDPERIKGRAGTVFNAPRPLFGSVVNGAALTWESKEDRVEGWFFAMVLTDDPQADLWIAENTKLDAAVIDWMPECEHRVNVLKWARGMCRRNGVALDEIPISDWDRMYRNTSDHVRIVGPILK